MIRSTPNPTQRCNTHRTTLPNGLVVLVTENPAADIVATRILIQAGGRREPLEQSGVSGLLASVLTKGTARQSSREIAETVESLGASLGADAASDYCMLGAKTVSADFPKILELMAEILRSPTFPEAEVALERRLAIQEVRSMQEQPFTVAYQQLQQALYGTHPYATGTVGTEKTLAQLGRSHIETYYQTHFHPNRSVISIAGRISIDEAIGRVTDAFGDWPQSDAFSETVPAVTRSASHQVATPQDTQQSVIMLGYLVPQVHHADYSALKVISTYLGNGLSSRLFVEFREKRGLAYDVSALYPTRLDASHFILYIGTAAHNTAIARQGLGEEMERLCHHPLTEDELQIAQNKLLGQYALGKQTNSQVAQLMGWYEILGLGIEFDQTFQQRCRAVTSEDIQQVAQRYFSASPFISMVGPGESLA
ncbi:MAG: M16 family metallopeptidase [Elainellaceae cyanobacterium]